MDELLDNSDINVEDKRPLTSILPTLLGIVLVMLAFFMRMVFFPGNTFVGMLGYALIAANGFVNLLFKEKAWYKRIVRVLGVIAYFYGWFIFRFGLFDSSRAIVFNVLVVILAVVLLIIYNTRSSIRKKQRSS